jgi:hypothetical protein
MTDAPDKATAGYPIVSLEKPFRNRKQQWQIHLPYRLFLSGYEKSNLLQNCSHKHGDLP